MRQHKTLKTHARTLRQRLSIALAEHSVDALLSGRLILWMRHLLVHKLTILISVLTPRCWSSTRVEALEAERTVALKLQKDPYSSIKILLVIEMFGRENDHL